VANASDLAVDVYVFRSRICGDTVVEAGTSAKRGWRWPTGALAQLRANTLVVGADAYLPSGANILRDREYPDSNLGLPFRDGQSHR
jgi:hypothetical protein